MEKPLFYAPAHLEKITATKGLSINLQELKVHTSSYKLVRKTMRCMYKDFCPARHCTGYLLERVRLPARKYRLMCCIVSLFVRLRD